MKNYTFSPTSYPRFQLLKKNTQRFLLLSLVLLFCTACGHRYVNKKVDLNEKDRTEVLQKYQPKKYFILHNQRTQVHLSAVIINEFEEKLLARTEELHSTHTLYKPTPGKTSHKFNDKLGDPNTEIHLYTNADVAISPGNEMELPLSQIDSIIVHNTDVGYEVIKAVGITAGVAVVTVALVAALKSSCPFIYSYDGNHYAFEGELYPGAIRPTLERTDYIPLKYLKEKNGSYAIKVSNELKEIQYTNHLKLIEVQHPETYRAMIDQRGNIHTIQKPASPVSMLIGEQPAELNEILKADSKSFLFNDITRDDEFQDLTLQFDRPGQTSRAKLILRLKNSYWLDYTFGKFYEKFGSSFVEFQQKNRNQPNKKSMKWLKEQGILLDVFVKQNEDWILVESIQTVGPLSFRDLVVPIDLNGINSESLQIKLSSGFMFWELDQIQIDYSKNEPLEIHKLQTARAIDQNGMEVTDLLAYKDDQHLVQPHIGDAVFVNFKSETKPKPGYKISLFMENSGFYEYIRSYEGLANKAELISFRKKGAFTRFSRTNYFDFVMGRKTLEDMVSVDYAQ